MEKISVLDLSIWIINNLPKLQNQLTHLKLQKLVFYCYGIASAKGFSEYFDDSFAFEAWEHGLG